MHTSLPDFKKKMNGAAAKYGDKEFELRGIENLRSAKMQSMRTGRIENELQKLASDPRAAKLEVVVLPRVPETSHDVVVKSYDKDGNPIKAVVEILAVLNLTAENEIAGFKDVEDKRPPLLSKQG
jgi:hypothetical protein